MRPGWPAPGPEAIQYLAGTGKYSLRDEYPLPDLLLLDLKMPIVDGFDVLKWVRAQPSLSSLVVIVLTMSEAAKHPHMLAREVFVNRHGVTQPAPAPRFSRTPSAIREAEVADLSAIIGEWKAARQR